MARDRALGAEQDQHGVRHGALHQVLAQGTELNLQCFIRKRILHWFTVKWRSVEKTYMDNEAK